MENLKSILNQILKKNPQLASYSFIQELQGAWVQIVGEKIARKTTPMRLTDGTLFVSTESSTWAHTLKFSELQIMEKIKAFFSARQKTVSINKIHFLIR